ncbi:MAG TPA: 30S ribosomal protein S9 [Elusimicrobia bacterium]|nr:MAG: 30S ribosomal protein S9 [Elusimicrobia bacterium RIFOXYA12_FULL_49_49]OGS09186.1 MAG: 30S ribosomal protein S9 [Elusimicrobia bacterium RIFOXYA1_FULL_47_7]OGS09876.1 MAG: 30S ribosomal protein S9 [Elusimicrobia bacterium RIFOXYB1_FULL_48_9]OGS14998.1 MAG: 30S ribosomal protein S9 [Elusimicrobia bacterium RIFOXYA2_FULL_47_53]OGS26067.1 MAG: 30S ribosomal protein S9 [Elusimicrobia bacterium RIFOXYB12_FULL_50_12]OGS29342.1 MAG: 30S ribosomal protein S9 [Elusimicrobia bacterium RIFOXYB2_F
MSQSANTPIMATGRRKNATARVKVLPGSGKISVNNRTMDEYFGGLGRHKMEAARPLDYSKESKGYDYYIDVMGGGIAGQSGAIRHGLSRAMLKIDPSSKATLKKEGLLTRDPRMVERKKPGRPKARKRFQFSKR